MAYKKGCTSFNAEVDTSVNNCFKKQWKKRGQVKNDAVTAALRLWTGLTSELQVKFIEENPEDVLAVLEETFLHQIYRDYLKSLPEPERKALLRKAIEDKMKQ